MKLHVFATEHRTADTMDITDPTESHDIFLGNS